MLQTAFTSLDADGRAGGSGGVSVGLLGRAPKGVGERKGMLLGGGVSAPVSEKGELEVVGVAQSNNAKAENNVAKSRRLDMMKMHPKQYVKKYYACSE